MNREIRVCQGVESSAVALKAILGQMDGSNFPVHAEDLHSNIQTVQQVDEYLNQQSFHTYRKHLNHPGGGNHLR